MNKKQLSFLLAMSLALTSAGCTKEKEYVLVNESGEIILTKITTNKNNCF